MMKSEEFHQLRQEQEKHAMNAEKKKARIDRMRKDLKAKKRQIKKQCSEALATVNARYDAKIADANKKVKEKIALLKDKVEFSEWQSEKIDDIFESVFSDGEDALPSTTVQATRDPVEKAATLKPTEQDPLHQIIIDLRYTLKNATTYRKEFNAFKKAIVPIVLAGETRSRIDKIMEQIDTIGKVTSKEGMAQLLSKINEIIDVLEQDANCNGK